MAQELEWLGNEVLAIARNVLQRRGSARIIEIATSRVDVRGLLNEYRQFIAECERQLAQSGINVTSAAIKVLREEWSDALNEHQRRAMVGR
jgi:hypothetical protein